MNSLILKQTALFISILGLVLGVALLASPSRAAADASDAAKHYCLHKTPQNVCEQAFDDGAPGANHKSVADACQAYADGSPEKATCQSAWGRGASEDPAVYGCSSGQCDFVGKYINPAVNLLSVSFGLIAVISLILGGIQYSTSEGDPQKSASAKSRITNTIIAIFAYIFLYAFLQFIIPGGAFH